jgi:hypothetical protein
MLKALNVSVLIQQDQNKLNKISDWADVSSGFVFFFFSSHAPNASFAMHTGDMVDREYIHLESLSTHVIYQPK